MCRDCRPPAGCSFISCSILAECHVSPCFSRSSRTCSWWFSAGCSPGTWRKRKRARSAVARPAGAECDVAAADGFSTAATRAGTAGTAIIGVFATGANIAACTAGRSCVAADQCRDAEEQACAASGGAPSVARANHHRLGCSAAHAVGADDAAEQQLRHRAQQPVYDHRRDIVDHDAAEDRESAGRHQSAGGESPAAVSRRVAGFRGQRRSACAQRARQSTGPYQRHHDAGWRHRFLELPRSVLDRQPVAGRRRAAGGIRTAHDRTARHHDTQRPVQQFRHGRRLWRQPQHHHAVFRIRRHFRRRLSGDQHRRAEIRDLLRRRAVFLHRPLPEHPRRHREPAADAQRHSRLLAAGQRLRLSVDLRRSVDAHDHDDGHVDHELSDSEYTQCADQRERDAGTIQFFVAQRAAGRGYPVRRSGRAAFGQRLRRAIVLLHPLRQCALHAGPDRRSAAQRHRVRCQPPGLYQRRAGRCVLCDELGAYAANGLHRERRKNLGRQYLDRGAVHGVRRNRQRAADVDLRQQLQSRLSRRHLRAGRMEAHQ